MRPELPSLAVEAGVAQGWHQWVDDVVSIDRFGASAPGGTVMRELGINVDNVVARARPSSAPDVPSLLTGEPMSRLHDLFDHEGQSPWLDNIRRGWITSGELERWIARGVRGLTSNPSIFQKAIQGSAEYDQQFTEAIGSGLGVEASYWELVTSDISAALDILRPVYDQSEGLDGYVSVEVDPGLARDSAGTEASARDLDERLAAPNLYIKIPATAEGLAPIQQMISEKRSINVTLIFSLERYAAVMEAYLAGLEAAPGDLSDISSVASFFISRVDVEIDRRLDEIGTEEALALKGKAAVANGKLAYELFRQTFSGPLGGARRAGRTSTASALGVDLDQEPRLFRHAVRRRVDRPRHGEHAARQHPRGLRTPRNRGSNRRRGRAGSPCGDRGLGRARHPHGRGHPEAGGRGCGGLREELRRTPRCPREKATGLT